MPTRVVRTATLNKTTTPQWDHAFDLGECSVADILFGSVLLTVKNEDTSNLKDFFDGSGVPHRHTAFAGWGRQRQH